MTDTGVIDERTAPATDGFAVQVRGLRMSYGSTEVLRGVDFDVRYGEGFCLLGPNGAGKTTTLEILEGFRPPTGGPARVLGLNPAAQAARLPERGGMVRASREGAARAGLAPRISFTPPSAIRRGQVALPDGLGLAVRGPVSVCHTDNAARTLRRLLDGALENRLGDLDGLAVSAPSLEDTYLQLSGPDPDL